MAIPVNKPGDQILGAYQSANPYLDIARDRFANWGMTESSIMLGSVAERLSRETGDRTVGPRSVLITMHGSDLVTGLVLLCLTLGYAAALGDLAEERIII